jgi:hypothetical protein
MLRSKKTRIGCGVLLLFLFVVLLSPVIIHNVGVFSQQAIWSGHNLTDYNITIRLARFGVTDNTRPDSIYVIRDGQVFDVVLVNTSTRMSTRAIENLTGNDTLQGYENPINHLFYRARICFMSCHIEYDATYGFPTIIRGGDVIQTDEYEVLSFEIINPN